MLGYRPPIRFDALQPPQLLVVIDTEEEFDWNAGPDRSATGVSAMAHIHRVQDLFDEYGIVPCYVIDYPIASQPEGRASLMQYAREGRAEIGAHLHPWVNPPYVEEVNAYNSYVGNLPREQELAKLKTLRDTIREHFGFAPRIYKAGRYGVGANTTGILKELGFDIDLSLCSAFDYRGDGGPDFSDCHAEPFWFGPGRKCLEIPVTGAFTGWSGPLRAPLYRLASRVDKLKARAILSRLGAVDRLMLSPEGYSSNEHIKITQDLLRRGVRTFTWSFHSPSVAPGFTPYVQNETELQQFLDMFRRYFDYFFGALGGVATTPTRLKQHLENPQ